MNILDQMKTLPLADATFDLETILRIAVFGTFIGHGWIAAWKLEFSGWVKVRRLMYTQLRLALLRPAPPCFAPASLGLSCSLTLLLPPFPPRPSFSSPSSCAPPGSTTTRRRSSCL